MAVPSLLSPQIMRGRIEHPLIRLQRQFGNQSVQRVIDISRHAEETSELSPIIERAIQRKLGSGRALERSVRAQMEAGFGADFGDVRVHTDSEAHRLNQALSASAFTTGQDIFFSQGAYNPGSAAGQELLAHELTHVLQQHSANVQHKRTLSQPVDQFEQEADRVARAVMQGEPEKSPSEENLDAVNRQVDEDEEETTVLTKAEDHLLARQIEPEEEEEPEEEIRAKAEKGTLQRQAEMDEEEHESLLQRKCRSHQPPRLLRKNAIFVVQRKEPPAWKESEKRFELILGDLKPKSPKSNLDKFKTGMDKLLLTLGQKKTIQDLAPKLKLDPKGQLLWQIITNTGASIWMMQQGKLPNLIPDIKLTDSLLLDVDLSGTFKEPKVMLNLKWSFE